MLGWCLMPSARLRLGSFDLQLTWCDNLESSCVGAWYDGDDVVFIVLTESLLAAGYPIGAISEAGDDYARRGAVLDR